MQYTKLGATGLTVSRLCLGTMTFGLQTDETTSHRIMDTAAAAGVTFLDTADVYPLGGDLTTIGRTEEVVGNWLKGKRHQYILATKAVGKVGDAALVLADHGAEPAEEHERHQDCTRDETPTANPVVEVGNGSQHGGEQRYRPRDGPRAVVGYVVGVAIGCVCCVCHFSFSQNVHIAR